MMYGSLLRETLQLKAMSSSHRMGAAHNTILILIWIDLFYGGPVIHLQMDMNVLLAKRVMAVMILHVVRI